MKFTLDFQVGTRAGDENFRDDDIKIDVSLYINMDKIKIRKLEFYLLRENFGRHI